MQTKLHKAPERLFVFFTCDDTWGDQPLCSYHRAQKLARLPVAGLELASSCLRQKGDLLSEGRGILTSDTRVPGYQRLPIMRPSQPTCGVHKEATEPIPVSAAPQSPREINSIQLAALYH